MLALLPVGHKPCFFLCGAFLKCLPTDVHYIYSNQKVGIIHRSNSPWSYPLHMVKKKDGGWRWFIFSPQWVALL